MADESGRPFVRYHDLTPNTVEYDHELDAYVVARADIDSFDRRYRLTLVVVVTEAQMIVHRPGLEQAIRQGRAVLERLVVLYQATAAQLTANVSQVYTMGGVRLR
jgi:hypothetical protein